MKVRKRRRRLPSSLFISELALVSLASRGIACRPARMRGFTLESSSSGIPLGDGLHTLDQHVVGESGAQSFHARQGFEQVSDYTLPGRLDQRSRVHAQTTALNRKGREAWHASYFADCGCGGRAAVRQPVLRVAGEAGMD